MDFFITEKKKINNLKYIFDNFNHYILCFNNKKKLIFVNKKMNIDFNFELFKDENIYDYFLKFCKKNQNETIEMIKEKIFNNQLNKIYYSKF